METGLFAIAVGLLVCIVPILIWVIADRRFWK